MDTEKTINTKELFELLKKLQGPNHIKFSRLESYLKRGLFSHAQDGIGTGKVRSFNRNDVVIVKAICDIMDVYHEDEMAKEYSRGLQNIAERDPDGLFDIVIYFRGSGRYPESRDGIIKNVEAVSREISLFLTMTPEIYGKKSYPKQHVAFIDDIWGLQGMALPVFIVPVHHIAFLVNSLW